MRNNTLSILTTLSLLLAFGHVYSSFSAEPPAGKLIWWGQQITRGESWDRTKGVLESGGVIASNIIDVVAGNFHGMALRNDGSVIGFGDLFGGIEVPNAVTNIDSITMGRGVYWAKRRDGSVVVWGNPVVESNVNTINGLSNVTAMAYTLFGEILVLRKDKSLTEYSLGQIYEATSTFDPATGQPMPIRSEFRPVRTLTNIMALDGEQLILDAQGTVFGLDPMHARGDRTIPDKIQPITLGGEVLSNVTAIVSGPAHHLALKKDGTVVSWDQSYYGETNVPVGLSNVIAIAADEGYSLTLKKDGTVVAWGANHRGQASVPAGLSNVVKIAAAGWFSMALTTGAVPASVYITPHGRLERMARDADLIFKGEAISSERITNAAFKIASPNGMELQRTKFKIISVLQGDLKTNYISFQHYSGWTPGGHGWSGSHEPAMYKFEPGKCFIVYAANLSRSNVFSYYEPLPGTSDAPDEFRELADPPAQDDDGVTRTLDARPVAKDISVKEAHWAEFNLLLHDAVATNRFYAAQHLNWLSQLCGSSWGHADDFSRSRVLKAVSPLISDPNEQVAIEAINCFHVGGDCATQLVAYIPGLLSVANDSAQSVARRVKAMVAFNGTKFPVLTNALPKWLADPSDEVRAEAVSLAADFPGKFSEQALRDRAKDASPKVRVSVAEAIGNQQIVSLLPTLQELLKDPVGLTNPLPPLTIEDVRASEQIWTEEKGDVHLAAGYALLKFDAAPTYEILKANLDDPGFRAKYLCKLAESNAAPWVSGIAEVLEIRRAENEKKAKATGGTLDSYMYLSGTYLKCWETLYKYLRNLDPKEFADNKQERYIAALEFSSDANGNQYPLVLYELYRKKGLSERAATFRTAMEKKFATFGIKTAFDQVDSGVSFSDIK